MTPLSICDSKFCADRPRQQVARIAEEDLMSRLGFDLLNLQ